MYENYELVKSKLIYLHVIQVEFVVDAGVDSNKLLKESVAIKVAKLINT